MRNIRVAFAYLDEDMIRKIIVTLICPKLEYAMVAWSPWLKEDVRKINKEYKELQLRWYKNYKT